MTTSVPTETCFFERDPTHALARRAGVEAVGTMLLMFAATGSAIVAASFGLPSAAALLMHAVATSGALVGLIIALGAVSGGHFNPIITAGQWLAGERSTRCLVAYVICQTAGGIAGAVLARCVFAAASVTPSAPSDWSLVASEVLATASLMIVVFGCSRAKRADTGPFAVGVWLAGMIIFTPSSYANPAIAIGALVAAGPIVIPASTAAYFVLAQILGGLIALWVVSLGYGDTGKMTAESKTLP